MSLDQDIKLNSDAFSDAAEGMAGLKTRAEALKEKLQQMYSDITTALDTPAEDVLIQPIDDLILVIDQMSRTLDDIISTPYYQRVFDKYDELVESINF